MNSTTDAIELTYFDVRRIPCAAKHARIFQRWAELPVGEAFVLINDHDPVPLYYQFETLFRRAFRWEYLMDGPAEFHVKITRLAPSPTTTPPLPPRGVARPRNVVEEFDLRGLEAPEPLIKILNQLEMAHPGETFRARTDRQPIHLFPELAARGAKHICASAPDGSWVTTITRG